MLSSGHGLKTGQGFVEEGEQTKGGKKESVRGGGKDRKGQQPRFLKIGAGKSAQKQKPRLKGKGRGYKNDVEKNKNQRKTVVNDKF